MLDALASHPTTPRPRWPWLATAALVVAAIALVGTLGALRFVEGERERDLLGWQARLGLVAEGRATMVADWVARQREAAKAIAENATLQLYLTELALAGGDRTLVTDEAGQAGYVRNLILVAAERAGFVSSRPPLDVPANVARSGGAGIAVFDPVQRLLVATQAPPALDGALMALAKAGLAASAFDLVFDAGGQPYFVAAVPVAPLQGTSDAQAVGVVVAIREIDSSFFQLLERPPTPERSAESILVRRRDGMVELLSPGRGATQTIGRRLAANARELALVYAVDSPGGFALKRDADDTEVLAVGRAVAGTSWVLSHSVRRQEALAQSDARLGRMLTLLLLGVGALALSMVAVWRHGASRTARAEADQAAAMARRFEAQSRLLRLVTDNQPADLFIVDREGVLRYANRQVAERVGAAAEDLVGRRLAGAFPLAIATSYANGNQAALDSAATQIVLDRREEAGSVRHTRRAHVPLPSTGGAGGALVVEEDITAAISERERRERVLQQIVCTLVDLVDRRDPFAANHSERVAAVSRAIATEMGISPLETETAETAGRLMNMGKALVPSALLTREGRIGEEEKARVHEALKNGVELLAGIEFNGPVVETLRQAPERWDGTGPRGAAGERIILPARIVAVANAFVAMISARSYRPSADTDGALAAITAESGRAFDRRVVAALVNVMENRGGRARFAG
jgi:PAS domain S-box-containing protein